MTTEKQEEKVILNFGLEVAVTKPKQECVHTGDTKKSHALNQTHCQQASNEEIPLGVTAVESKQPAGFDAKAYC